MIANYHTHTKRCKHATGEDREYVEAAIETGLKILVACAAEMAVGTILDGSTARLRSDSRVKAKNKHIIGDRA